MAILTTEVRTKVQVARDLEQQMALGPLLPGDRFGRRQQREVGNPGTLRSRWQRGASPILWERHLPPCHPDRSAAQWRDLRFGGSFVEMFFDANANIPGANERV
jgi:hypothetical protein